MEAFLEQDISWKRNTPGHTRSNSFFFNRHWQRIFDIDGRRMIAFTQPRVLDNYRTDTENSHKGLERRDGCVKGWPGECSERDKNSRMSMWAFLHRLSLGMPERDAWLSPFYGLFNRPSEKKSDFFFLRLSCSSVIVLRFAPVNQILSSVHLCLPSVWSGKMDAIYLQSRAAWEGLRIWGGVWPRRGGED